MAGSTNIQVWNPTFSNQENDAAYAADSLRSGGAQPDNIMPSPTFNKFGCNVSSPIAALCQAMANKGYVLSDANYAALVAVMANVQTAADVKPEMISVAYSASLTFDCTKANGFAVTLTGNVTSLTVSGAAFPQRITLAFTQDGTGGRTVSFPTNVKSPGTPSAAANAASVQVFEVLPDGNLHPVGPMTVS